MDTTIATLACCLLALSFAVAQPENSNPTITPPTSTAGLNLTHTTTMRTSPNSTVRATVTANSTEDTTQYTSANSDNGSFTNTTAVTNESTSHPQTSQSATTFTPLTNTLPKTTTPSTQTPTFTALTTQTIQTTVGYTSTPDTPVTATENSSCTVTTTSDSSNRTTEGLGLNISEKTMTIVFSAVLGVFAVALVTFMFHKCKQKIQYLHQPLNNTDDTDAFVADSDTLVISGGLYDGHPIYDNVPPVPADQSQFRLEFLH